MSPLAQRSCPVCEHRAVDILRSQRFALPEGHPLSDGYDVVCCNRCGLVYADTAVGQEAYDLFYAQHSKYEDRTTSTGGGESIWDRKRLEATAQRIASFLENSSARILDMGCANGGLLRALQAMGYKNLVGIDPSPACVANTQQLGIEACEGSFSSPLGHDPFDCVVLSHILEHVQDLRSAARWLAGALKADRASWLYVEVPDATRYADYLYAPFQEFNTEHINHFSQICLESHFRNSGFEVVRSGNALQEVAPRILYPVIYCLAKPITTSAADRIEKDSALRGHIERYIAESSRLLDQIEGRLQMALANVAQVIVWGTGQLVMKLLVETSLSRVPVAAFVDSNPINQGRILRGVPVVAPHAIASMREPIVVGTILSQESVVEQIRKMGLANELILLTG